MLLLFFFFVHAVPSPKKAFSTLSCALLATLYPLGLLLNFSSSRPCKIISNGNYSLAPSHHTAKAMWNLLVFHNAICISVSLHVHSFPFLFLYECSLRSKKKPDSFIIFIISICYRTSLPWAYVLPMPLLFLPAFYPVLATSDNLNYWIS